MHLSFCYSASLPITFGNRRGNTTSKSLPKGKKQVQNLILNKEQLFVYISLFSYIYTLLLMLTDVLSIRCREGSRISTIHGGIE